MGYHFGMARRSKESARASLTAAALAAALALGLAGGACEEEDTRPESFGLLCSADPTLCEAPFSCMDTVDGMACSITCVDDGECPAWHQAGRCPGDMVSTCEGGVCDPMLCRVE